MFFPTTILFSFEYSLWYNKDGKKNVGKNGHLSWQWCCFSLLCRNRNMCSQVWYCICPNCVKTQCLMQLVGHIIRNLHEFTTSVIEKCLRYIRHESVVQIMISTDIYLKYANEISRMILRSCMTTIHLVMQCTVLCRGCKRFLANPRKETGSFNWNQEPNIWAWHAGFRNITAVSRCFYSFRSQPLRNELAHSIMVPSLSGELGAGRCRIQQLVGGF